MRGGKGKRWGGGCVKLLGVGLRRLDERGFKSIGGVGWTRGVLGVIGGGGG